MKINLCAVRSLEINPDILGPHYQFKKIIGNGSEGLIYSAFSSTILEDVAIKILNDKNTEFIASVFKKISQLRHPNIVRYYKVKAYEKGCCIIMQQCDKDLLTSINDTSERHFQESDTKGLFSQILKGLEVCHQNRIFHGDVKPENILLRNGIVKLADFNVDIERYQQAKSNNAKNIDSCLNNSRQDFKNMFGSVPYQAPEIQNNSYDYNQFELEDKDFAAIDIWSLGVTLFIMVSGTMPWGSAVVTDPDYARYLQDRSSFWPDSFSKDLQSLLMAMLHPCPMNRMKLSEISKHSWLLQLKESSLKSSATSTSIPSPQSSINIEESGYSTPDCVGRQKRACSFDISPKTTTNTNMDVWDTTDNTRCHLPFGCNKRIKI